ncbi:MAG: hypothetical protein M5U01_10900 [Ardenticatenaceae bacterium]|nr:hypothetical protein [Ardenticatenaceae bacterium]HBY99076.1 hypothetical protein [Chloroflexota bacterium]
MKKTVVLITPLLILVMWITLTGDIYRWSPDADLAFASTGDATEVYTGNGIVGSITRAPIVPDGDVAGAPTDLVLDLDTSLDPSVTGRSLLAGKTIKVILPEEFENTGRLLTQDFFTSPTCVPGNLQCNSAILLQGWPQHPILPSVPPGQGLSRYSVTLEGTHIMVITANVDLTPGAPLPGPGIKQIHLILNGFRNPAPGFYDIQVLAKTGADGAIETGLGRVQILPQIRPSINVTSFYNPGSPNTIYQETSPGELAPLPYDLLLWDRNGAPMEGVTLSMVNPTHGLLVQGENSVGQFFIDTPPGASGQEIFSAAPSVPVPAPVSGVPTARLTAFFRAGSEVGEYGVTFELNGGNAVQMFVRVHEEID